MMGMEENERREEKNRDQIQIIFKNRIGFCLFPLVQGRRKGSP